MEERFPVPISAAQPVLSKDKLMTDFLPNDFQPNDCLCVKVSDDPFARQFVIEYDHVRKVPKGTTK